MPGRLRSTLQPPSRLVLRSLRTPAPDSTLRIDRMVDDLEHLRESLGLERMTLLAHSMGGALAYAYLSAHPDRVRGLVLVAATLPIPLRDGPPALFREVWPEADLEAIQARMEVFSREQAARAREVLDREGIIPDSIRHLPPDAPEVWSQLTDRQRTRLWRINFTAANACNPGRWREMEGGMVYYNPNVPTHIMAPDGGYAEWTERFWPALRDFKGPVEVVLGTCDFVDLGPTIWPRVVNHLHLGRLHPVEASGHALWMDRPEAFHQAVGASLDGIRGRTAPP